MNHWVHLLRDLPTLGQRLIARSQRISLPRNADAETRLARLRLALCHAATVRATYAALDPAEQSALQDLRAWRGGIRLAQLEQCYGPIRSWRQLATDPQPRSIAERLLLLGWLLPRPATARHATRYVLAPELRRWLPMPLHITVLGAAPTPPAPPALRAAALILLACAEQPLPLQRDGAPRIASLRLLAPRFGLADQAGTYDLCRFVLPLLNDLGLLAAHGEAAVLAPAGQRFLALAPAQQLTHLRAAWLRAPRPDTWLRRQLADAHGMDLPVFRRRLLSWAAALPVGQLLDPGSLSTALVAAFGPLADAQTHGFRAVDRAPWQPRRAAAIWDAAIRGPLTWLGALAWTAGDTDAREWCFATACARADVADADAEEPALVGGGRAVAEPATPASATDQSSAGTSATARWSYAAPGVIGVPHRALDAAVLRLLPYARWNAADTNTTCYRLTPRSLAAAQRHGHSLDVLWKLLTRQAGPAPNEWCADLPRTSDTIRIIHTAVVVSDHPAVLAQAAEQRSVRRYLHARLAPGIALADPKQVPALERTLARRDLAVEIRGAPSAAAPAELSPAACATLLAALKSYRTHELDGAAPPYITALEEQLCAALPIRLQQAAPPATAGATRPEPANRDPARREVFDGSEEVAFRLNAEPDQSSVDPVIQPAPAPAHGDEPAVACDPPAAPRSVAAHIVRLRQAIARRELIQLGYANAAGVSSERIIRPLRLENHAACWYLRAYCLLRQSERTFRVDRIGALETLARRPRCGDPPGRRARPVPESVPPKRRARVPAPAPRSGFFPAPPDPPPGSPLVRIWLEE